MRVVPYVALALILANCEDATEPVFGEPPIDGKAALVDGEHSDAFGASSATDGQTLAVGVPGAAAGGIDDDVRLNAAGAVRVFTLTGDGWAQAAILRAPDSFASDAFGAAVALSGGTLVVGAPGYDQRDPKVGGVDLGKVYVYEGGGGAWTLTQQLIADDASTDQRFGASVSLAGDLLIIGAPGYDGMLRDVGAIYFYERVAGTWQRAPNQMLNQSLP